MSASLEFLDAIAAAGLTPPDTIQGDGRIHRFSTNGKSRDDAGWYIFFDDDRPAGRFGCNRSGVDATWSAKSTKEFTPEQRKEWRARMKEREAQRDAAIQAERDNAAKEAERLWTIAKPVNGHAYIARKQIKPAGARELDGEILIPMRHGPGKLVGLQRIHEDGTKLFLKGTPAGGAYHVLGKPGDTIVICEGYATGASIHEATQLCTVVAFNAGNLPKVAAKIHAALPKSKLIIAADNDLTEGNPGLTAATEAATAVSALIAIPPAGKDFNDVHTADGLDAVAALIAKATVADNGASSSPTIADDAAAAFNPAPVVSSSGAGGVMAGHTDQPMIFASTPMKTAELFKETLPEGGRILFWRGEFYSWDGSRYVIRDKIYIEQRLYHFMAACLTIKKNPQTGDEEVIAFPPKRNTVEDVSHALRAVCYADIPEPQCWIEPNPGDPPAGEIIAFRNGFLHWPTRTLLPSSDRLFVTSALDFDYNPHADAPERWIKFLTDLWPNDPESIDALADMFGYLLTDDTSQQKMFMFIGPPRSGKGTILRVLESLVGYSNRVSPSLASIGTQFGLQPLIGKRLAMISDARLSGRADQQPIVENMLRISGEDALSIDRKNIAAWTGKLPTRFVLASNELPAFSDASAALANRFILFRFTESFLGREDMGLTGKLLTELPSIVMWALDGLDRLMERGYLLRPASANELAEDLIEQTSPIRSFVSERCDVGEMYSCDRDEIYAAWKKWCEEQGRDHPGTKIHFGRQLSAAFPMISRTQPRDGGTRLNLYTCVRIKPSYQPYGWNK